MLTLFAALALVTGVSGCNKRKATPVEVTKKDPKRPTLPDEPEVPNGDDNNGGNNNGGNNNGGNNNGGNNNGGNNNGGNNNGGNNNGGNNNGGNNNGGNNNGGNDNNNNNSGTTPPPTGGNDNTNDNSSADLDIDVTIDDGKTFNLRWDGDLDQGNGGWLVCDENGENCR